MKKTILLIAALILMVTATFASNVQVNDSLKATDGATLICAHNIIRDTVFILPHPDADDSVKVVKVVDGVLHIISQFVGDKPLLQIILDNRYTSGGIVGLVLAFWRRRELKKIKKKQEAKDAAPL